MQEEDCLELLQGTTDELKEAWNGQIQNDLLWKACWDSIHVESRSGCLGPWQAAFRTERDTQLNGQINPKTIIQIIAECMGPPHHGQAALGYLACARLVRHALEIVGQTPPGVKKLSPDELWPLVKRTADLVGCPCARDPDLGYLQVSGIAQELAKPQDTTATPAAATLDTIFRLLSSRPSSLSPPLSVSWFWDLARALLGEPRRSLTKEPLRVRFATVENETGQGVLLTLGLERLQPGTGQLCHHFQDVFRTACAEDFCSSLQKAWDLAKGDVPGKDAADGRFRVLRNDQPESKVLGRSASGAAAREWWNVWHEKKYDPRVIVIAQVDEAGQITGVADEAIKPKTRAIIEAKSFDTIVVANASNQSRAESLTQQQSPWVRVVNLEVAHIDK